MYDINVHIHVYNSCYILFGQILYFFHKAPMKKMQYVIKNNGNSEQI